MATEAKLRALFEALTARLTTIISDGVSVVTKTGDVITVDPPASYLAVAAKLLADNKITAVPENSALQKLAERLQSSAPLTEKEFAESVDLARAVNSNPFLN